MLLLSRYGRLGASSRIRSHQYLRYLQNHGIATVVQPLFGDDYVRDLYSSGPRKPTLIMRSYLRRAAQLATSYGYDLIWIEKEVLPWLPGWYELLTARLGLPYVVDLL